MEPVQIVKDPSADMALLAKRGSKTVRQYREMKEKKKEAEKLFNIAYSKLGELLGLNKYR